MERVYQKFSVAARREEKVYRQRDRSNTRLPKPLIKVASHERVERPKTVRLGKISSCQWYCNIEPTPKQLKRTIEFRHEAIRWV